MSGGLPDVAASIRRRLLNASRTTGENHQLLLTRYALERLLARLSASPERDRFVLKGALLFVLWSDRPHRATRDLDLLGRGDPSADELVTTFAEIVTTPVEADGLVFDTAAIVAKSIREAASYEGIRLTIPATLGKTRFRLQVDVGFGDAVEPRPKLVDYPVVLDHTPPRIKAYPREAVIAENLEAMVQLGMVNSRMKDLHDLWTLAHEHEFDGAILAKSIAATFRRRATPIPEVTPVALTEEFAEDASRIGLWRAFMGRVGLHEPRELRVAVEVLAAFSGPVLEALSHDRSWERTWRPGGPWRRRSRES